MVVVFRQRMGDGFSGRQHVRGVGLQQDPVVGELSEDVEHCGFPSMQEVTGEGKTGASLR